MKPPADDITACRACGGAPLRRVVSLGRTPLANALLTADQLERPEPRYPLDLAFCPACSLVQIMLTVPPEMLFADYPYFSSFSDTAVASAKALVGRVAGERALASRSFVLEIASNDGYLLQHYRALGIPVLGIEPAANVAKAAEARGVPTRCAFFGLELAEELVVAGVRADVIHANNVLAHVPDLNGVVAGIATLLKPQGIAIIEVPYLGDLVENCEFDTVYHEHLCYFSLSALEALFRRHGLAVTDVERLPLHGGSLRLFVGHRRTPVAERVGAMLAAERAAGMLSADYYAGFARRIEALGGTLLALLRSLKGEGKRLAAYGASAKGSTLLNVFGIGRELLDFVVDRSTVKQGRYTPGTHLEILAPEALVTRRPDYVLLLTWNFAEEILAQQAGYRAAGGRFILPVPEPRIV